MTLLLLIVALVALILLRVPLAIALLGVSIGYLTLSGTGSMRIALQQTIGGLDSFPLLAVPLFILLGNLAIATDIAGKLFVLAEALIGRVRAGLGYVNVLTSMMFSWINGNAIADTASLGKIQVPEMVKRGYDRSFTLGLTASSSLLGAIMPPSIVAIIYAVTAGVSIAGLFAASVVPALIVVVVLCIAVWVYGIRAQRSGRQLMSARTYSLREKGTLTLKTLPALLTPVILLGGIFGGFFTPTEAAAIAALYILIIGLFYRSFSFRKLAKVLYASISTTAGVMIVIGAASLYGWVLTREGAGALVADLFSGIGDNPWLFLILLNVILLVIGTFLESTAAILIFVPIIQPIAASFGIDPFQLGVVVIMNLVLGLLTPPIGILLYVLADVTKSSFGIVLRGVLPFLGLLLLLLLLFTFVPAIATMLPSIMGLG